MPTLILPPRHTPDSQALWKAAIGAGWEVERLMGWRAPEYLTEQEVVLYGDLAQDEDGWWKASSDEVKGALAIANAVIANEAIRLPPAVVLDVGTIVDRGWSVVEANPAWGSGMYGCDPSEVLHVIRRACVRRDAIGEQDRPWIIQRGS